MNDAVNNGSYRKRVLDDELEKWLKKRGAVCIEGPRWCGKTTTASKHSDSVLFVQKEGGAHGRSDVSYETLEDMLGGATPRLLDEWQEVPILWDAVIDAVDDRKANGQFILTGSASPENREGLRSGMGRIKRVTMRTMSLYESGDSSGEVSLKDICDGRLSPSDTGEISLLRLAELMVRGGWPEAVVDGINTSRIADEYISDVIESDIRNKNDGNYIRNEMSKLLRTLARCESGSPTYETIVKGVYGNDSAGNRDVLNAHRDTVARYLDFLDSLYLFDNTQAYSFSQNIRSGELVQEEDTRYFSDVSLACSCLNATPKKIVNDRKGASGAFFESLCVHDLKVYAQSFGGKVYHYRKNRPEGYDDEMDAVIELEDGRTCAFEIKVGAGQIDDASESLIGICDGIKRDGGTPPSVLCVICGTTDRAYRRDDGVFVVPITAMRP